MATRGKRIAITAGIGAIVVIGLAGILWREIYFWICPEASFLGRWETSGYEQPESHGIKRRPTDRFIYDFGGGGVMRFSHQRISSSSIDQESGAVQLHWREDFSSLDNYRLSGNAIVFFSDARKPFARKTYSFEGTEVLVLRDSENNVERLHRLRPEE